MLQANEMMIPAVKALHMPDVRMALKVALRVKLHPGARSSLLSVYKKYWMPFYISTCITNAQRAK